MEKEKARAIKTMLRERAKKRVANLNKRARTNQEVFQYLYKHMITGHIRLYEYDLENHTDGLMILYVKAKSRWEDPSDYLRVKSYLRSNGFIPNELGYHFR